MKRRYGFVSNSSSSSFMIGIARIVDKDKFKLWEEQLNCHDSPYEGYKIYRFKDIPRDCYDHYCFLANNDQEIVVDSFQEHTSIETNGMKPDDEIIVFNIINDEGDSDFAIYNNGEFLDYDYDIGLDHFDEDQAELYEGLKKENGLASISKTYGAGRNG